MPKVKTAKPAKKKPTVRELLRETQYWMMQGHAEAFKGQCDRQCSYHRLNRLINKTLGKPRPEKDTHHGRS